MKLSNKQAETVVAALHYWAREIEADPDFESGLTELQTYRLAKEFDYLTGGPNRRHGLRCKLSAGFSMKGGTDAA